MTGFPENVTLFPKNVTCFPKRGALYSDYFVIYDKLYDRKVLGILKGDPAYWKCDLVSQKCEPVS